MFFRPLITAVLCCLVACGHAPAWLHVATCGEASGTDLGGYAIGGGHHACCHHSNPFAGRVDSKVSAGSRHDVSAHASQSRSASESSPCSGRPAGEHSGDDCVICQSLMSAVGHIEFEVPVSAALEPLYLSGVEASDPLSEGVARALHLRGPPSC